MNSIIAETPPGLSRTKRVLLGFSITAVVCLLVAVAVGYYVFSPNSPRNRKNVIQTVMKWGRLEPFPVREKELFIQSTGSMFTRGFRVRFHAPASKIEDWLKASPGTREAGPERPTSTTRKYFIRPGGGAQGAEVTVDDDTHTVMIHVYWS
jgi:hypothetical protein